MTPASRAKDEAPQLKTARRTPGQQPDGPGDGRKPDAIATTATLAEAAYAEIRGQIIRLEMPPGLVFSEADLADRLQLSKTPVREALLRVRLEGLVEVQPRAGYRVAPVTLKDARDLGEYRAMLEGEVASAVAAGVAARAVGPAAVAELESLRPESVQGRIDSPSAFQRWISAEHAFHAHLSRMTANGRFVQSEARILDEFERLCRLGLALSPCVMEMPHDHAALLSAILAGDATRARTLAVEEAVSVQERIMDALLSSESVATVMIGLPDVKRASAFYLDVPKAQGEEV
jgi:DNA-binding GntR family transcriptional regulator